MAEFLRRQRRRALGGVVDVDTYRLRKLRRALRWALRFGLFCWVNVRR